jgi:hypothetical protein
MRIKILCITTVLILLLACKSTKQLIIESNHYNIVLLQFNEANIESVNYNLYSNKNFLITSLKHSRDFNPKFEHQLILTKGMDTMRLKCIFPIYQNFYIKNIDFKEGRYLLKYNNSKNGFLNNSKIGKVMGKEIKTPTSTQEILFKNLSIIDSIHGQTTKSLELKDIKFNIVDFSNNLITFEVIEY